MVVQGIRIRGVREINCFFKSGGRLPDSSRGLIFSDESVDLDGGRPRSDDVSSLAFLEIFAIDKVTLVVLCGGLGLLLKAILTT